MLRRNRWLNWWSARPLLILVCSWLVGQMSGYSYTQSEPMTLWVWIGMGLLGIISLFVSLAFRWVRVGLLIGGFALGMLYMAWSNASQKSEWSIQSTMQMQGSVQLNQPMQMQGWLAEVPVVDGDRFSGVAWLSPVEDKKAQSDRNIQAKSSEYEYERVKWSLRLPNQAAQLLAKQWQRGDRVIFQGELERPDTGSNFEGFDGREWLRKKGVYWQLRIGKTAILPDRQETKLVELPWRDLPAWSVQTVILSPIDQWRTWIKERFQATFANDPALSGLLVSMQIGDRSDLLPEWAEAYQRFGLTHVLAISGSNVALWCGALLFVLRRFFMTEEQIARYIMCSIPFYVMMTGADSSVMRAGVMAMMVLWARSRNEKLDGMHVLAGCVLLLTMIEPFYLLDVGFQLSVLVTMAIIWLVSVTQKAATWQQALLIPLVAQWLTLPHAVFLFHQWSWCSFPLNVLVVPIFGFVLIPFSIVAVLLDLILPIQIVYPFVALVSGAHRVIETAIEWAAQLEAFPLMIPTTPNAVLWWMGYLWISMQLMQWIRKRFSDANKGLSVDLQAYRSVENDRVSKCFWGKWNRWKPQLVLVITIFGFAIWTYQPTWLQIWSARWQGTDYGLVRFFDVGQGDAALVRTPEGKVLLIDAGPIPLVRGEAWRKTQKSFDTGRDVLAPLLREMGVHTIDALIASHQDTDHVGGMAALLTRFPVKEIWTNGTRAEKEAADRMFEIANDNGVIERALVAGMQTKLDNYTNVSVLAPSDAWIKGSDHQEQNDLSLLLRIVIHGTSFLFTGDLGETRERDLLAGKLRKEDAPIDVLKVAHHGSKYSTKLDWLAFWRPRISVISVGENNLYHHPHPDLIARLQALGTTIFRTDRQGELQFSWQNGKLVTREKNSVQKANDSAYLSSR